MFTSSAHIRKLIKPKNDKSIPDILRMKIHNTHKFVFLIVGMSIYTNTDTSLLTQKLFKCDNFASDCMLFHNIILTLVALKQSVTEKSDFLVLVCSVWAALLCHICHIIIGVFGNGKHARNMFILIFAIMGFVRAMLVFSCPGVIDKLFYMSAFVLLNNSRSGCALILGVFQTILNNLIGFNTISEIRLNLILCHGFQALLTVIGGLWITLLYFQYHDHVDKKIDFEVRVQDVSKKFQGFKYIPYYLSRFILYHLGSFKYLFHPGLIPFLLEISAGAKLRGSVIYTFCEFVGRNIALGIDETILPKSGVKLDTLFLFLRDIPLFFLIFIIIVLNSVILYSSFSGKLDIGRNETKVLIAVAVSGFVYGYIITRGTTGSKAIFDYQSKKNPSISGELKESSSKVVSQVLTTSYYCSLLIPYFSSRIFQYSLKRKKQSRDYIIARNYGSLSPESVDLLYNLFQK